MKEKQFKNVYNFPLILVSQYRMVFKLKKCLYISPQTLYCTYLFLSLFLFGDVNLLAVHGGLSVVWGRPGAALHLLGIFSRRLLCTVDSCLSQQLIDLLQRLLGHVFSLHLPQLHSLLPRHQFLFVLSVTCD